MERGNKEMARGEKQIKGVRGGMDLIRVGWH